MSNRPATVTQADVARVIRACRQCGVTIARVVVRADGVSVEAVDEDGNTQAYPVRVEERPIVVL